MQTMDQSQLSPACSAKSGTFQSRLETVVHATVVGAAFVFVVAVVLGILPA